MTTPGAVVALFAQVDLPMRGQTISKASGLLLSDAFLIAAIAVFLLLLLLFWAKYLRNFKVRKPKSDAEKVYRDPQAPEPEQESATAESRRRYKYRYRRRSHRSRNPTLAEAGGLPPARTGESVDP